MQVTPTFQVVQSVPQHFENTHIQSVAEGFVAEADPGILLNTQKKKAHTDYFTTFNKYVVKAAFYLLPGLLSKQHPEFSARSQKQTSSPKGQRWTRQKQLNLQQEEPQPLCKLSYRTMSMRCWRTSTDTSTSLSPAPTDRGDTEKLELTVEK